MCYCFSDFPLNPAFNAVVARLLDIRASEIAASAATTANSSGAAQVAIGETKPGKPIELIDRDR